MRNRRAVNEGLNVVHVNFQPERGGLLVWKAVERPADDADWDKSYPTAEDHRLYGIPSKRRPAGR